MQKKIIIAFVTAFMLGQTQLAAAGKKPAAQPSAQAHHGQPFSKGKLYLGGALGLGSGMGYFGGVALMANAEYAVTNEIGIGGSIGYWGYSESISGFGVTTKVSYSIVPVIVSGAYHIPLKVAKLDVAAGLSLGYYVVSSSVESSVAGYNYSGTSSSGIAWGVFGLVRYFVTDSVALRGKLGYGITFLEVGVDFRI